MNLQIKVDAANSNATIANVERGLAKTEDQAKKTQQACDALGGTFKRIADHERFLAGETRKAQQAVDSLGGSFSAIAKHQIGQTLANTAKAFDGLTEAIHREQKMLESIHGPMQKHMQDLQTLDALQRKGAISAEQHANALARSRSKNGVANPLDAVSLQTPSSRSSFAGAGSGLGSLPSIAAAGFAAKQVLDLSDSYTNLENRLRQVAGSTGNLNALMEKTRGIADASRADWGATGETFVRVSKATRDLGLSQSETLKLTESMSKAISMSGATGSEATAGMLQLSQALQSGVLAGDEFKSVNENLGDVMDVIAKQMGVPRGALKELAAQGQITSKVIVEAFQSARASIDENFNKTIPTASQQWALLKNQMTESAGEFVRTSGVMDSLSSAVSGASKVVGAASWTFGKLKTVTGALGDAFTSIINPGNLFTDGLGQIKDALAGNDGPMDRWANGMQKMFDATDPTTEAIVKMTAELGAMHARLSGNVVSVEQFAASMSTLHAELSKKFNVAGTMGWLLSGGAFADASARVGGLINDPWGGQNPVEKFLDDRKRLEEIMSGNLGKNRFDDLELVNRLNDEGKISTLDYALAMDRLTETTNLHVAAVKKNKENFKEWLEILRTEPTYLDTNAQAWAREKAIREGMVNAMIRAEKKLWDSHNDSVDASLDKQLEHAKANAEWISNAKGGAYEEFQRKGLDATARVNNALNDLSNDAMKSLVESAYDFGDALVDSIFEADFSWKKFMDNMARDLLKQTVHGGLQLGLGALGLGGGRTGFDAMVPGGMGAFLPGFRTGGDMLVGGSGAPDSKIAAFRVSPGETLHVRTPEQRRAMDRSGGGGSVVNVYVPGSRNGNVLSEQEVEGVVVRVIEKQSGVIGPRLR